MNVFVRRISYAFQILLANLKTEAIEAGKTRTKVRVKRHERAKGRREGESGSTEGDHRREDGG